MSAPRVLVLSTSAKNPFLEAWLACIKASGARTTVLVDARRTREAELPAVLGSGAVLLSTSETSDWRRRVLECLGGPPDLVFDWWGMAALGRRLVVDTWPGLPRVLCVDTYPNASRARAELRDYAQANLLLGRASGLAVASRAMRKNIDRTTGGRWHDMPAAVVYSPFPLSAHYRGDPIPRSPGPLRLCFTGRSDYLFSADPGMAKDAVGDYLAEFIELGATVHVMRPQDAVAEQLLTDRGFDFYEDVPRDDIIRGALATTISRFDGHLVVYSQPHRTVRRRIANSLSTRFATALCAPTPIVAPRSAEFVDELFDEHQIGFRSDEHRTILDRLEADGASMRSTWFEGHETWAGEAYAEELARLWAAVLRR